MLYLFGNCQSGFLAEALARKGHPTTFRPLASPLTYLSCNGRIPRDITEAVARFGLDPFFNDRTLFNQCVMFSGQEPEARLFLINLFHETTPLFLNEAEKYAIYVDQAAFAFAPGFKNWLAARHRAIVPHPDSYLARFGDMVEAFRTRHPGTPLVILGRLSHFPFFGPTPFSYLECWEKVFHRAGPLLAEWAAGLPGTALIDVDRIFAGIWADSEPAIEAHCPFLRVRRGPGGDLTYRRDLEHVGSLWDRLADKIAVFLDTGRLDYGPNETVPAIWTERPHAPETLSRSRLRTLLSSGANYASGRAVAAFFSVPDTDHTKLLAEAAPAMPICHHTLHMVRHYAGLHKNPALLVWISAQLEKIGAFTANGPAYQRLYESRLKQIAAAVTGRGADADSLS
ncbi:SGNH/GDSL hydrolase family protein [Desulfolutivibrio sulfoxidireducens]|uniref:SGNH/GDSL hydrolase family protein n=1 Tax=Desulfolutivibrio sulfoxidireducens TaxID=2773299 RepID=UPI00159E69D3|nr:SGNH/GDSL hydrolase family protein [Desulfolutivibrio sulfoxidireducens]QLA20066.1 SGNH/GDSL hydrolase family protein [Desulfolutivibrio sulfoxidireducens]